MYLTMWIWQEIFRQLQNMPNNFSHPQFFVTRKIRVGEIVWPNNVWRGHIRNSDMSLPASNPSRISVEEMSTIGASMTSML